MPLLSSFLLIQSSAALILAVSVLLITNPNAVLSSTTLSLLGSSMHIRPATFIPDPVLPASSLTNKGFQSSTNPLASLTRTKKTSFTTPERELLSLLGLVLAAAAASTMVLAFPLRFSRSGLTTTTVTKDDSATSNKTQRKPTAQLAESIAALNLVQTTWQVFAGLHVVAASIFVAWVYVLRNERRTPTSFSAAVLRDAEGVDARTLLANNVTFALGMVDMLFWGYLYTTIKEERRTVLEVVGRRREEDAEDEMR